MMENTELIAEMEGSLSYVEQLLDRFESAQDDNSDEDNQNHIIEAKRALEDLTGHVLDLVP